MLIVNVKIFHLRCRASVVMTKFSFVLQRNSQELSNGNGFVLCNETKVQLRSQSRSQWIFNLDIRKITMKLIVFCKTNK